MQQPLVSAIVLNYRSPRDTVQCVRALQSQTIADRTEILVVDNHSDTDAIGVIRNRLTNIPNVRILETPKNVGYGKGNNFALHYAQGEFVLIINPDNALEEGALEHMINILQNDDTIGIVAPKLMHADGSIRSSVRKFPTIADVFIKRTFLQRFFQTRLAEYLEQNKDISEMRDVDWAVGACLLMRKSMYEQLEGFDPRFFFFLEDTDL